MQLQTTGPGAWTRRDKVIAIVILLFACWIRLLGIGSQSIWQDEAYSVVVARQPLGTVLDSQVEDSSPPLYYALLHFWIRAFGDTEASVRFLSLIFGVCLVGAVIAIGARMFSPYVGLIAGAMLASAPLAVYYSQEARMYSLTPLLALLSVYFCYRLSENPTRRATIKFMAATAALLYTQNYGVFILLAEALYLLSRRKVSRDARPMLALMGAVALYVPWLMIMARQAVKNTTPWIPKPHARMLFETLLHLSFKSWRLPVSGMLRAMWGIGLCALGGVAIWGVYSVLRATRAEGEAARRWARQGLLVLSYVAVPIVCAFIISQTKPIYVPGRYDTIVQPGLFLICALGLVSLRPKLIRASALVVILLVAVLSLQTYFERYNKSNDRQIADYLVRNAGESDIILFTDLTITPFIYYNPESPLETLRFPRSHLGWIPKAAFTDRDEYFEDQYRILTRRINTLWPEKVRLWVVYKSEPAIYQRLLARLKRQSWLRLLQSIPFRMGDNVDNQAEAVFVFRITGPPG